MIFLRVPADQIEHFRCEPTPHHGLDPRVMDIGPWAGDAILPMAVLTDPYMAPMHDELTALEQITILPPDVFLPPEEE